MLSNHPGEALIGAKIQGLICPGLETVAKNRMFWLHSTSNRGDLDLQYLGKLLQESVLVK